MLAAVSRSIVPCLFILALAVHAQAFWTFSSEFVSLDITGDFRSTAAGTRNYDDPVLFGVDNRYDVISQTFARIISEGTIREHVSFEFHLVLETYAEPQASGTLPVAFRTSAINTPYRISKPAWYLVEDSDFNITTNADRMNVSLEMNPVSITLGRQAIDFSRSYFWNPLDIFQPFSPDAFDRDYRPGSDALRVDIAMEQSSSLSLVASTGRKLLPLVSGTGIIVLTEDLGVDQWYASALVARYQTVLRDSDLILQGGKVYGGYQVGAGFNKTFGPVGLHAEGALFLARGDSSVLILDAGTSSEQYQVDLFENHLAVVLGVNHRFENGLFFNLDYLFNGGGNDDYLFDALLRSALGGTLSLSRQLAGLQVSYDFHQRITGGLSWIYSLSDGSSLACPALRYSVSDASEFRLGGILAFGKRPSSEQTSFLVPESEFGTYSHSAYFQFFFSF